MQRLDLDFASVASDSKSAGPPGPKTMLVSGISPGLTSDMTEASDVKTPCIAQETC